MKYPYPVFRIQMFTIQWMKFFYVLFFIPYYKWVTATASCMYCTLGQFGYGDPRAIAPYGIFWYIFYWGISRFGYSIFLFFLIGFDTVIFLFTLRFQSKLYITLFMLSSIVLFVENPADLFVLWLAVIGKEAPIMSILSALTKLPWNAPPFVWKFVFQVSLPSANNYLLGWPRYIMLGLWMIHPSFYWLRLKIFERMS